MSADACYFAAWGREPMIVNDDEIGMPPLPDDHGWLVTREVTQAGDKAHPTYRVALLWVGGIDGGADFEVRRYGHIDKTFYGEAGVVELARKYAAELKAGAK